MPPTRRAPGLLDFGPAGTLVLLLGGAIPATAALVTGVQALRYIAPDQAVAEVIGFERRTRIAEPERGARYAYETMAPQLRFRQPDREGDVTITWRETQPHEADFSVGDRVWVFFPRGSPDTAVLSVTDIMLKPLVFALFAAPLLAVGGVSLRRLLWRRRQPR